MTRPRAARTLPDARGGRDGKDGVSPWRARTAMRGTWVSAALAALQPVFVLPVFAQGQPNPGRYDGRLCVTTSVALQQCGPAEVVLFNGGRASVRISDVRYELTLSGSQVDVGLLHGTMQIDGFTGVYAWKGAGSDAVLHFVDAEKKVHYEVRFADLAAAAR